jgi:cytochrome P450
MSDVTRTSVDGDEIVVICGHERLRAAARDWRTYTSATPFRVPIPEESALRPVRQFPIETDPPQHRAYRQLIEHRFSRGAAERVRPVVDRVVGDVLAAAVERGTIDVVAELALPLVTRAIAETMGRPGDTDRFLSWGLHVFRDPDSGERRANADLDRYLADRVDEALTVGGDDLFGDLAAAEFDGRPLDRDEILGFGYLVLAGGRDTVIAAITGALAHLAAAPDDRTRLRRAPEGVPAAVEEFLRCVSPLPMIGRTATTDHRIGDQTIAAGELVALGFAAANRDDRVFDAPHECRIDRSPNRHVAFGHGPHTCIGAPLARMELSVVVEHVVRLDLCELVRPDHWEPSPPDVASTHPTTPEALILRVR